MEKIRDYGVCGKFEVNLMRWEKEDINPSLGVLITDRNVIDIRIWKEGIPDNGVCLLNDMIIAFLFHCAINQDKVSTVWKSGKHRNVDFYIYEKIATLCRNKNKELVFTRCSFRGMSDNPGYDLRYWDAGMTKFTKGVHMTSDDRFLVGKALADYLDEEKVTFPNWNVCFTGKSFSAQDVIANLAVSLDRSYLLGNPSKINMLAERIIKMISEE